MAKKPHAHEVKETKGTQSKAAAHKEVDRDALAQESRDVLAKHRDKVAADEQVAAEAAVNAEKDTKKKVFLHDGKPGSGAGLKPGDWHAPASNPGAAARVLDHPMQPESAQSHGMGIIYDKDLANPPYDQGDPKKTDEGPSGSGSPSNLPLGSQKD